jgi:hypothetical protein
MQPHKPAQKRPVIQPVNTPEKNRRIWRSQTRLSFNGKDLMPAKTFSLHDGMPSELKVSWKRAFKETQVFCQGQLLCSFPGRQELEDGGHVVLPDGSDLFIALDRRELVLIHNGWPVPGSSTSAHKIVKHGAYAFNAIALITAMLGAYVVVTLENMNYASDSAIFGLFACLFILCGYLLSKGKRAAGIFGLLLSLLHVWFWVVFIADHFNNLAALVFLALHVYLVVKIILAIPAIRRFNMYVTPE